MAGPYHTPGELEFTWRGIPIRVERMKTTPFYYMFIHIGPRDPKSGGYFFGHYQEGMTRGQIKQMALRFLKEHPQVWKGLVTEKE